MRYIIGIDEVGRAASKRRASPHESFVIGIDEVGRGSLAGPVVVCAVAVPQRWRPIATSMTRHRSGKRQKITLRDSKKLSPKQREDWFKYLVQHPTLCYSVARVYPRRIEKMNIAKAANLAALCAFRRLLKSSRLPLVSCRIYLDGGLYLGNGNPSTSSGRTVVRTIVRGDEKFTSIKIASIIAKVSRDRLMVRLAKKYPQYGFEVHKGYGTKAHFSAIRKHGPSPVHRLTFLGNTAKINRRNTIL